ncbi:N-acetylmuramoyl-L-alanine amidase [Domibacillus epiphyticus]|uniref:MurNAc-LAA domain-containing protein n=1 Tax=Domibacillus epiphyticus TaxID=1714355 RepID=A0A1V2A8Y0_9BACI|nr:N-acetylmuramoyl-L-alanine amidase [Domibacillus epiphyticus]OMP67443.1 hypothetical protein BTO28_05705 [Domibacillus epiphyticus]
MKKIVVLDAGHGLPDLGAIGYLIEYEWTLKIVREVVNRLPDEIKVVLTRIGRRALHKVKTNDLNTRCAISNNANADLFVSIHLNAGDGTGYETLVYSPNEKGNAVHSEIAKTLGKYGVKDRGIKIRTDLAILKDTKATALLLECLFLDSEEDVKKLQNSAFFSDFCQAIVIGISKALGVTVKTTVGEGNRETPSRIHKKAVEWARMNSIFDGSDPAEPITRQQVLQMIYNDNKRKGTL